MVWEIERLGFAPGFSPFAALTPSPPSIPADKYIPPEKERKEEIGLPPFKPPLLFVADAEEVAEGVEEETEYDEENPDLQYHLNAAKSRSAEIRAEAVGRLGGFTGSEEAVKMLLKLSEDPSPEVRRRTVAVLDNHGGDLFHYDNIVKALEKRLQEDDNEVVRFIAIWSLQNLNAVSSVPVIIEGLKKDRSGVVRETAAEMLGTLKDPRAIDPLIRHGLQDKSGNVRGFAARALSALQAKRAVPFLIPNLRFPDALARWQTADALGELGDQRAVVPLLESLRDGEPSVRQSAVRALGNLGAKQAIDAIAHLLQDPHELVQNHAAIALGQLGDARAIGRLIAIIQNEETETIEKEATWNALLQIDDPRAANAVKKYGGKEKLMIYYKKAAERAQKEGRYADVIANYQELMRISPKDHSPSLKLADLYRTLGALDKAEEHYQKSIEICPDCDGLAAKKALAELELQKKTPAEPITFLGLGKVSPPGLEKGLFLSLSGFIFEGLRKNGLDARIPDVDTATTKEGFNLERAFCSDATCTAEIAGAFGHKAGLHTKIEEIKGSKEWVITLYYVATQSAAVIHQASVKIAKGALKNADDAKNLAEKLAGEMAKELRKN